MLHLPARKGTISQWGDTHLWNSRLYALDRTLSLRVPPKVCRGEAALLYRLWLGVAFPFVYAYRTGMAGTAACGHNGLGESIGHILCGCPQYNAEKKSLRYAHNQLDYRPLSKEGMLRRREDLTLRKKPFKRYCDS